MTLMRFSRFVLACAAATIAGCGTSPSVSYFTLAAESRTAAPGATDATYAVTVGPVTVPEVVDRPHIVLRTSATEVRIAEYARWAAPLKAEIPRVIAADLARLLPGANTSTSVQRAVGSPDYRVLVDVQRFDSSLGEHATIEASWSVRAPGGGLASGRSVASEPAGAGYNDLAAAHSRALAVVSRDIAAAVTKLRSEQRTSPPPATPAAAPPASVIIVPAPVR